VLAFPILAVAIALVAIGRGGNKMFFEERPRDAMARRVMFWAGIGILVLDIGWGIF